MTFNSFDTVIDRRNTSSIKWTKYGDEDVIPMWVADMEFAIAPEITQALQRRIEHPIMGYTRAPAELYEAVTAYLQRSYQWTIDESWLVWLPGVVPGLTAACNMARTRAGSVLVPTPVYHPLLHIPGKTGQQRIDVPLQYAHNRWSIDFDQLDKLARHPDAQTLLLCSPHNPVGTVYTSEELRQLSEICSAHNVLVVSDEIHCDLVLDPNAVHVPTAVAAGDLADNTITLMSPSKTYNLAGANCSFAIIPNATVRERFSAACSYSVPIVPTLSYVAAQAAYTHGQAWQTALIEHLRRNHATLRSAVEALPYVWMDPTAATYLAWINTSVMPVDDPCEFFREHGVGLSPGAQFGDPDYQRLNFACAGTQLHEGLTRIETALATLG